MLPARAAACCLFLLAGCASESTFGIVLNRHGFAEITVLGPKPVVEIANDGPGSIDARLRSADGSDQALHLGGGRAQRTLHGGGSIRLVLADGERAVVVVKVWRTTGTSLRTDTAPVPREP